MALSRKLLLMVALVLAICCSGAGGWERDDDGAGCLLGNSLISCAPPEGTPVTADDGTVFRAGLAPLLATLPSAAAGTGFASLRSEGADRAHAFGLCFGEPDHDRCLSCLSAAVAAVAELCGNDTRRAGVWRDGCLLAYADHDASEFQTLAGGKRDQALAYYLGRALAMGQWLWRKARSLVFYSLAAVGACAVTLLLCVVVAVYMLARTLFGQSAAVASAGHAAAAGQGGEGITAFVVVSDGRSPLFSFGVQVRFY